MLSIDATTLLTIGLLLLAGFRSHWTGRLVILLLLSPGLRYFSALFTFPIRLTLSRWAGSLLQLAGLSVQVEGNVLIRDGQEMAVDPACMGLQMTGVSLLVALFFLIYLEKQTYKQVPLSWVISYGLVTFALTIACNLCRIVILVALSLQPGTIAHDVAGLICVAAYAWLPTWLLARQFVKHFGQADQQTSRAISARKQLRSLGLNIALLGIGLGIMAYTSHPVEPIADLCQLKHRYGFNDYACKPLANGFVRLTKPGKLVYLKPLPDWFSAEHSPTACWRGSGYEIRRVRESVFDGHPAYVGELRKNGQTLQTAWWFSDGQQVTISQLDVRGRIMRGEKHFALVNVTWTQPQIW